MSRYPSDVAFTPAVKAIQKAKGSRDKYAKVEGDHGWETTVTDELAAFLAELDMFYFATANAKKIASVTTLPALFLRFRTNRWKPPALHMKNN